MDGTAQSSRGRDGDAERALLASWQLNASLRDRPDRLSPLTAESIMRTQTGRARRLRIDPASWRARRGDHDYRASVMRALVVDAISGLRMLPAGASQLDRASRADHLDVTRAELVRLRDLQFGAPLAGELTPAAPVREVLSLGEAMAATLRAGADHDRFRIDRLILDAELIDRVRHARLLRARLGRWPAAIPDIERSRRADVHWIDTVGQEGRMSISLSQPLQGSGLPLRFESRE